MNNNAYQAFLEQWRVLLVYLERPAVRDQLLAVIAAVMVGILVAAGLRWGMRRYVLRRSGPAPTEEEQPDPAAYAGPRWRFWLRRWLSASRVLFDAIFCLAAVWLMQALFVWSARPAGIVESSLLLVAGLLAYSVVVTSIYAVTAQKKAAYFHWWILFPIFILTILFTVGRVLFDFNSFTELAVFSIGDYVLTVGRFLTAVLILYFSLAFSRVLQEMLRWSIRLQGNIDHDVRDSIVKLGRNIIIVGGILTAGATLGISLTSLTVIGGGLSVGIGLGLQKIASNFVSGILLWTDETIRLGDVIEVNDEYGTVEKMGIRSTLVRTLDNVELIVPNEDFLTSTVTAYTKSNRQVRATITVGVSYNSDPKQVRDVLVDTAGKHGLVLDNPAPIVHFSAFNDSSIDFKLLVWVDEPVTVASVSSDLHFMIWQAFEAYDIEIPFPQRDLHLRGDWERIDGRDDADGEV